MSDGPKSTIVFDGDSTGAVAALHAVDVAAKNTATAVQGTGAALSKVGDGADAGVNKAVDATKRFEAQLKRLNLELESGGRNTAAYIEGRAKLAGVDTAALAPLIAQYEQIKAKQAIANAEFTKSGRILDQYGNTAKGTAAALRQVPAQFTDIIVSLQGGQAPLTVLLQQGGQLKDVFGGVGNAAKAMGGYVLDLINPFTATAAAIGTLGYAYYVGAEEAKAFQKTLIETGGAAGVTVGQLTDIAKSMDALGTTQGRAAETLNTFAAAGVSGSVALERYALAAIKLADAGGTAVGDTVKAFSELGKEPLTASLKLNESMNYLTESVYQQIKSLDEQGRHTEAAAVAQNAYAQAIESRTPALLANLGLIENAWLGIKNATKEAWDFAKNIGRTDSLETQAKALSETINKYKKNGYDTSKEESDLSALTKRIMLQQDSAQLDKQRADSVKALAQWDKEGLKYLSDKAKLERDITAAKNEGISAGRSQEEIEARIAAIRKSHTKSGPKTKSESSPFDTEQAKAYAKYIEEFQQAELKAQIQTDGLTASQGKLVAMLTDPVFQAMPETWKQTQLAAAYSAIAIEQNVDATKLATKAQSEYLEKLGSAGAKEVASLEARLQKQTQHNAEIGKTAEQIEAIRRVSEDAATAELEGQEKAITALLEKNEALLDYGDSQALLSGQAKEIYELELKSLREQIKLRKQLAKGYGEGETLEAAANAAKASAAEWKRGWEETDRLARDVFTTWATDGSNAAQKIGDTLKKALLSAIYEATIKPIAFQLYTSIAGGGAAGAVQGASNALSGGSSLLSGLSSVTGAFGSSLSANFGATMSSFGSTIGLSIEGGLASIAEGTAASVASGLGSIAGALGPVAVGIGALSALKSAMDYKVEATGNALVANLGGGATVVANRNDFQQTGGLFGGGTTQNSEWSAASAELTAYMDAQVKLVTESARAYGTALGLPVADLDSFKQQIEVSLTGLNADQAKEAINKAIGGFGDALVSANFGPALDGLKQSGETSSATLVRVATEITAVNGTLGMLGGKLLSVDAAGIKAADGLVQAMGGLEAFQQQTASYYSQYYSQEEQRMQTALSIQARLAQGGIDVSIEQVLNGTREQFRALVDSFKDGGGLMDEAGQKAVAALMAVAGAFAGITTASANVSASSAEAAATESSFGAGVGTSGPSQSGWSGPGGPDGASEAANAILQERKTLQDELDNLTMTSTELLEKQRNALDESNRALFDQIQVAKEAARVAEQNKSLQDEYNQLTMTSAQLRALEREQIAEANLELFDRITALKAEQEAITTANNAVDAALAGVQRAIDAEKKGIEAARQAAQERAGILKSIVDSIGSAVDNLRGNVDSTKAQAARQANAFIDNALATAQASGYMPDADDLKDAISKATGGIDREGLSQFEYERAQLVLAGKLEGLKAVASPQLTAAQEAVKVAEAQLKALDDQLAAAQESINVLRGIDTSILSVEEALAKLAAALGVAESVGVGGSGGAVTINPGDYQANGTSTGALEYIGESTGGLSNDFWRMWSTHMQNVYGEDAGYKVYNMAIERGVTAAQLEEILGMSAGQANAWALSHGLAAFDVGTNMVPRDMVAQIHEGEAIIPKAYNPAAGGVSGNARLESLVEGLTKEVQRLQAIVNDGNKSNERIATAVNGNPDRPVPIDVLENSAGLATA